MVRRKTGIETGSIVSRFDGPQGEDIAAIVRLPARVWADLGESLLYALLDRKDIPDDRDERLRAAIALFLDVTVADWQSSFTDEAPYGDLEDDVPF